MQCRERLLQAAALMFRERERNKIEMERNILFIVLINICMAVGAQHKTPEMFYTGTFTSEGAEGIYLCSFDQASGDISQVQVFKAVDNPNYLNTSPDGKYLYVVSRSPKPIDPDGGSVLAYRIKPDRMLEFLNIQSSHGDDPCYVEVSADGKFVAVANYGGGSVALFPVKDDGSLEPASSVIRHEGSGPNKARQQKAYAHSIRFSKVNDLLYAADLGTDKLFIYSLDRTSKKLIPASQPFVMLPPGSGPRHFDFTGDMKYFYVANELLSTVTVFQNMDGQMSEIQTISALPSDFAGVSYCADIHLSPDGKYVYASNRGHQSIVVFRREDDGKLTYLKNVSTEGNWPRNFALDPSGIYMLVANQRSHNITVFRMENGIPVFTGKELKIPAPVCIEF
jgi:6-phosphogluconolactonase